MRRFLRANELTASSVTKLLLGNMSELESCDPLVFYNVLKDVIKDYRPSMLEVKGELRRASAEILEPIGKLKSQSVIFSQSLRATSCQ